MMQEPVYMAKKEQMALLHLIHKITGKRGYYTKHEIIIFKKNAS